MKKTLEITNEIIDKTTFEENRKHAKAIISVLQKTDNAENEFLAMYTQLENAKKAYYGMTDKVSNLLEKTYEIVQKKLVASEKKEDGKPAMVEEDKVFLVESILRTLALLEEWRMASWKFFYAYNDDERRLAIKNMSAMSQKFHSYVDQIQSNLPDGEAKQYFEQAIPIFHKLK